MGVLMRPFCYNTASVSSAFQRTKMYRIVYISCLNISSFHGSMASRLDNIINDYVSKLLLSKGHTDYSLY
jgi:hypothetical protein